MKKIFDIGSSHGDMFVWSGLPPETYKGIIIPGSSFHTVEALVGYMAMQHIARPDYSIWISNYLMRERRKTHVRADYAALEFSLVIQNNVLFDLAGFGKIDQKEAQFNLFYFNDIDSKVLFEGGNHYATFDIHCNFSFLERLANEYPRVIEPLLNDMLAGRMHQVFPRYLYATPYMMQTVGNITHMLTNVNRDEFMLDSTVLILIVNALAIKMEMVKPSSMRDFDRSDRMNMISNLLIKDLSAFPSIQSLAKKAGMNETTFTNTFRDVIGLNPYEFWTGHRLAHAYDRLVNARNLPIKEIALELGFANLQSFSKKISQRFNRPPSSFRK